MQQLRVGGCRGGRVGRFSQQPDVSSATIPRRLAPRPSAPASATRPIVSPGSDRVLDTGLLGDGDNGMWELMPETRGGIFSDIERVPSTGGADALRRKGHLKEQDALIEFMRNLHDTHTCEEVMLKMEGWIEEHRRKPKHSRLRKLLPQLGTFFKPLELVRALKEYDEAFSYALTRRKYIPPNFAELRHILNISQVHASAGCLKLITFDADGTLYPDGYHFDENNEMVSLIIGLMRCDVHVAIVTAAGHPGEPEKFESGVSGLLNAFRAMDLPPEITSKFHFMGGECNYLLCVNPDNKRLEFVPDEEWKTEEMKAWASEDIAELLKRAKVMLQEAVTRLGLKVTFVQKERTVGIIPMSCALYEVLEDIALSVQTNLKSKVPFCAFNGGNDVFVDVGNKSLGLQALMAYLGIESKATVHVGDRFTTSGNDMAVRNLCPILWVANPDETGFFIKMLLRDVFKLRNESKEKMLPS